jgi:hypothetical protein
MKKIIYLIVLVVAVFFISGCYTERYYTRHNEQRNNRDRYRYDRYDRYDRYHYNNYPRYHRHPRVGISVHWRNW